MFTSFVEDTEREANRNKNVYSLKKGLKKESLIESIHSSTLEIFLSSSIHGLPQIFRTKRLFFKIMWILVVAATSSACAYFVPKTIFDYFNYETITKIDSINEHVSQFPTVSICNYNNASFELNILSVFYNFEDLKNKWKQHFESFNDSRYGRCYRFNSGKNIQGKSIPIKNVTSAGYYYGLELNLYAETTNDFSQLKVYIHNYTNQPSSLSNKGYFLSSGSYNHFSIDRIYNELLEEPYNDCYKDLSMFPLNKTLIDYIRNKNSSYSQNECLQLCQNQKYLEESNCNCSLNSIEEILYSKCVKKSNNPSVKNCTSKFIENFQQLNVYKVCSQYCPLECDSNRFVTSHVSQQIPVHGKINNSFYFTELNTYENVSRSFFLIYVYYENLKITVISQQPKMRLFDLISNIGGLFGIFLGMGILSFIEIIEIAFEILLVVVKKN